MRTRLRKSWRSLLTSLSNVDMTNLIARTVANNQASIEPKLRQSTISQFKSLNNAAALAANANPTAVACRVRRRQVRGSTSSWSSKKWKFSRWWLRLSDTQPNCSLMSTQAQIYWTTSSIFAPNGGRSVVNSSTFIHFTPMMILNSQSAAWYGAAKFFWLSQSAR